jgi:hypothetical protein
MKIRIAHLIACVMLIASMPSVLATISYGGASVEVPAGLPAIAEGDSNLVVDWGGFLGFGGYTAGPTAGAIVVDPFGIGGTAKYAHAWVFTGAYSQGAYAEWKGVKTANSYDVVDGQAAAGTYTMSAKVDGQAISSVTADPLQGGNPYAESLIDAWAAETTGPRILWGNAQITSAVFHDGSGSATAGTTAMNTVGVTQPSAKASYAAQRAINWGGSVGIPAKILGSVEGVTSLEANNFETLLTNGFAQGYSSISSGAFAFATDTDYQSYTQSDITTQTQAARTGGLLQTQESKVVGSANGVSEARAWDPSGDWFTAKTSGTETAYSSVSGQTRSTSQAYKVGDFTSGFFGGPASAQIHAAAGDQIDVTTLGYLDGRDSISYTMTDGWVTRTLAQAAPNYVYTENFIDNGNANSFGKDGMSGMTASTAITNVQQSSGAHAVNPTLGWQGSIGGMVARAKYDTWNTPQTNQVDLGVAGGANPFFGGHSGLYTQGPSWTLDRFDDAGTYLEAASQIATSTSSAGTYSISSGPVRIVEWVAGNDPLNNMYVTTPISFTYTKPVNAFIVPLDNPVQYNRNPEFYGWSGIVFGDQ